MINLFRTKYRELGLVIGVIWVLRLISRFNFHGMIFRFNYDLAFPDGICYSARSLKWLGYSWADAQFKILEFYETAGLNSWTHNYGTPPILPSIQVFSASCESTKGRLLYPLISSQFVKFFGMYGLLIVNAIVMTLILVVLFGYALKRQFSLVNVGAILISLITSSTFVRWGISDLVDPLLALIVLVGYIHMQKAWSTDDKRSRRKSYLFFTLCMSLGMLTRRSELIWTLLIAYPLLKTFLLHRGMNKFELRREVLISVTSSFSYLVVFSTVIQRLAPQNSPAAFNLDFFHMVLRIGHVIGTELGELAMLDIPLFILVFAIIYLSWRNRSQVEVVFPSLMLFLLLLQSGLNTTLGLNFRLAFPVIPLIALGLFEAGKREVVE